MVAPQQWPPSGLTPRQREVALLLGSGMSNKEIARRLGLSVGTVKQHVHTILLKAGARTRFELVALAAGSNGV
jgi:DNA-binding CsgD family transcriptional regulator